MGYSSSVTDLPVENAELGEVFQRHVSGVCWPVRLALVRASIVHVPCPHHDRNLSLCAIIAGLAGLSDRIGSSGRASMVVVSCMGDKNSLAHACMMKLALKKLAVNSRDFRACCADLDYFCSPSRLQPGLTIRQNSRAQHTIKRTTKAVFGTLFGSPSVATTAHLSPSQQLG